MREYQETAKAKLKRVICNRCGKALRVENGILKEGCFYAEAHFGYFSRKDGVKQQFDLCEDCYDAVTAQFAVQPEQEPDTELL